MEFKHSNDQVMCVEKLIHSTKNNVAKYPLFDKDFYKFPSYLRRAVIATAVGAVCSYRKNLSNWQETLVGNPPTLQLKSYSFPTFYKDNMYKRKESYVAKIKVYHKKDWIWLEIPLRKSDVDYIINHKSHAKEVAPTLEKRHKVWELRFAYVERQELSNRKDRIISVDLGITSDATVTAMTPEGTVLGRKFISNPKEKDRMMSLLNQIKRNQQRGNFRNPRLWSLANNKNRRITEQTAQKIIEFAVLYNADVIVFEALSFGGRIRGSKKQRLHLWRKRGIQEIVMTRAHLLGMRISRVNPWGTSSLAFDGSGPVIRGELLASGRKNYQLCLFSTGKEYNSDLNASYNIGSRYYIREILKSLPEMERLAVEAKVPQLTKRTTCVLADLISLNVVLGGFATKLLSETVQKSSSLVA
jgi:IS605 OrfB family transposase